MAAVGRVLLANEGQFIEFTLTRSVNPTNADEQTFVYSTPDWFGLPAAITEVYGNYGSNISFFGQTQKIPAWNINSITNLVIDLTGQFLPAGTGPYVPDLNNDGTIGIAPNQ